MGPSKEVPAYVEMKAKCDPGRGCDPPARYVQTSEVCIMVTPRSRGVNAPRTDSTSQDSATEQPTSKAKKRSAAQKNRKQKKDRDRPRTRSPKKTENAAVPQEPATPPPSVPAEAKRETPANGETHEPSPERFRLLGKSLACFQVGKLQWFLPRYVPRSLLTLVVGKPTTGKSTFLAWLMSQAQKAVLFPGHEEAFTVMTLPRLYRHGIKGGQVHVVDEGEWLLPERESGVVRLVQALKADLVVFDTLSSYVPEGMSANDPVAVRGFLEALARIAAKTEAAVVGSRHPGQNPNNIMPDSREWRAVPKSIVELKVDDGPPMKRWMRLEKDSLGQGESVQEFSLVGERGTPLLFQVGVELDAQEVALRTKVPDAIDRKKHKMAVDLLRRVLAETPQWSKSVYEQGEKERISERTIFNAAIEIGVVMEREGKGQNHKCHWSLPDEGGVSQSGIAGVGECGS
jgi:AAA domain